MNSNEETLQIIKTCIVDNMNDSCVEQTGVSLAKMTPALWEQIGEKDDASYFRAHREDAREMLIEQLGEDHDLVVNFAATWRDIYKSYCR